MDDQNMNSKVEIIGFINPMNMEFEFKEVNYEFSRFFGDRMIGVSQIDESDCIYLDCIKGEMQIRVSMSIEHRNRERSEGVILSFYHSEFVQNEVIQEIASYIKANMDEKYLMKECISRLINLLLEKLIYIDL